MAELKTKATTASVKDFINSVADEQKRRDSFELVKIFEGLTKAKAKMWGPAIIGFKDTPYKYPDGREMPWFATGFSPRKAALTLYNCGGWDAKLLAKLGKHKTGKGCLYIKKLSDVDIKVLKELIKK